MVCKQRCVAVAILLTAMVGGWQSRVDASCGDYLVDQIVGNSVASHDGEQNWGLLQTMASDHHTPTGPSRCRNGQCRSVPLPAIPETPINPVVRESGFTLLARDCHGDSCDRGSWHRPLNCDAIAEPFLSVDTPPPRRSS